MSNWGMGYGVFGLFIMILFWALFLGGVIFGIRWLLHDGDPASPPGRDTPMEILRKRYARGEIDKEEFGSRKRDLA